MGITGGSEGGVSENPKGIYYDEEFEAEDKKCVLLDIVTQEGKTLPKGTLTEQRLYCDKTEYRCSSSNSCR